MNYIALALIVLGLSPVAPSSEPVHTESKLTDDAMIDIAAARLIEMQQDDGAWPYEGVYRVSGEIPVGYRVGGTSLVSIALLHAVGAEDQAGNAAMLRGLKFVLANLGHRLMAPSREDRYDVRVWGHACALEFLCRVDESGRAGPLGDEVRSWIPALAQTLVQEEIENGGWNYANRRRPAAFVTAPVVQALLWARHRGAEVDIAVLQRAARSIQEARSKAGGFHYAGTPSNARPNSPRAKVQGSIARMALCEGTLRMLGHGNESTVQQALDAFHEHWEELEKRRARTGTHKPPFGIAPYYFYFGHRYAAQAISFLPENRRARERQKLRAKLLRTRADNGTWNDRVFPRSANYGTAMALICLLGDRVPSPSLNGGGADQAPATELETVQTTR